MCSAHFQQTDFCGVKGLSNTKPRLKADAIPSLLLNPDPHFAVKRRKIATLVMQSASNSGLCNVLTPTTDACLYTVPSPSMLPSDDSQLRDIVDVHNDACVQQCSYLATGTYVQ